MPNPDNITRPVTLVGHGRSGTSVIFNAFRRHPDFDAAGETAPLLFGTWLAMERCKGIVRPDSTLPEAADFEERCAGAVRAAFLSAFPSDRPRWMHKPIGAPFVWQLLQRQGMEPPAFFAWYWRAMRRSFPGGRVVTVLRHPYDVMLSAERYWGAAHEASWRQLAFMARLLTAPDSAVEAAVSFDDLVADGPAELGRLFDRLGLAMAPGALTALDVGWVTEMGVHRRSRAEAADRFAAGFSRRAEWGRIDRAGLAQPGRAAIAALWRRFGRDLEL
jgi:hypothetical protein